MTHEFDLSEMGEGMVYMRPVKVAELPEDVRATAGERDIICAVHNHTGDTIAFVATAQLAGALAREHGMQPVALH